MKIDSRRRLKGIAVNLEETGETRTDDERTNWHRCIFTVELAGFSSRPSSLMTPKPCSRVRRSTPCSSDTAWMK